MKPGWYIIEGRILNQKIYAFLTEEGLKLAKPNGQMIPLTNVELMSFTVYRAFKFKGQVVIKHAGILKKRRVNSYGEGTKYLRFISELLDGETIRKTESADIIIRKWIVKDSGDWALYEPFEPISIDEIPNDLLKQLEVFGRLHMQPIKFEYRKASLHEFMDTKYFNDGDELYDFMKSTYNAWVIFFEKKGDTLILYDDYIE